jgi:hypothetical protein
MQFSTGYILDGQSSKLSVPSNLYYGISVGYRSAKTQTFCEVSCDGLVQTMKKSLEGFDYHGILGYRFRDNIELKFDYSIDEEYYSLDIGYLY